MSTNNQVILVPHDFSKVADCAVNHAAKLAQTLNGSISLLHVISKPSQEEDVKSKLTQIAADIKKQYNVEARVVIELGNIFDDIGAVAEKENARLIIMGTHGMKGMQFITGSYALRVITNSKVPFIVVQEKNIRSGYQKIVCPLDFSKDTKQKVRLTAHMAKYFNAKVYIIIPPTNDEFLQNDINRNLGFTEATLEANGIAYEVTTADSGNFTKQIIKHAVAVDADLLAIMNDDEAALPGFIGGGDEQSMITNDAQIPVLIVNPAHVSRGGVLGS